MVFFIIILQILSVYLSLGADLGPLVKFTIMFGIRMEFTN